MKCIGYNTLVDIRRLDHIVQEECHLLRDLPVLIGVSGGADSLTLMHILHRLGYPLIVAHFDHGLRSDSAIDAENVRGMAADLDLPFILGQGAVADQAKDEKLSIEEAARNARYRFLFTQAEKFKAQAVVVAHTADDQVETVLMHLLRGSGLAGLRGMALCIENHPWHSTIPLGRPLLSTWRSEINDYCAKNHLNPVQDPTNADPIYTRNRIRHALIPYLEQYNPRMKEQVWRMSATLTADYAVIETVTNQTWDACLLESHPGHLVFSRTILQNQPQAIQRAILRRAIGQLHPHLRDVTFTPVDQAVKFINQPSNTNQINLLDGLRLFYEGDRLFLANWGASLLEAQWPQMESSASYILSIPGSLEFENGWSLEATLLSTRPGGFTVHTRNTFQAFVDEETLILPLIIRTARPGDRFQPFGMNGHSQKLSDFWTNAHLSRRARTGWPLVCSREQIIWVPGFRLAHSVQVTESTRQILQLEMLQR